MGQWLTCCLSPSGPLGDQEAHHDVFSLRTVTLFMDSPGCACASDLWLSIWCRGDIVVNTWDAELKMEWLEMCGSVCG